MRKYMLYCLILIVLLFSIVVKREVFHYDDNINIALGDTNTSGDVNGDGKVSSADYILVKKHILNIDVLTGNKLKKADVNGDSKVTSADYLKIKKIIMGEDSQATNIKVTSIQFDKTSADLEVGKNFKLSYTITPSNATNKDVTCTSSNTSIASIKDGKIVANKIGTATITCKCQDKTTKMTVKIYEYYDIALLWGQSNMVGRAGQYAKEKTTNNVSKLTNIDADILKNTKSYARVEMSMPKGVAYEYKYASNKLYDISNNPNTFGEDLYYNKGSMSSKSDGGAKIEPSSGTNMIPYFAKEYYAQTKHKLIVVFAASGGKSINNFLPKATNNLYKIITTKFKKADKYILNKSSYYRIRNRFYVVYQGESDCNKDLAANYERDYLTVHNNLVKDLNLSFGAMVYVAPGKSTISMSNASVQKVREQEKKLVKEHDDIIMGSDFPYSQLSIGNRNVLCPGDNEIHYIGAALSQIGRDVAKSIAASGKLK